MSCGCKDVVLGKWGRSVKSVLTEAISPPSTALSGGEVLSGLLTFECAANRSGDSGVVEEALLFESVGDEEVPAGLITDLVLFDSPVSVAAVGSVFVPPSPAVILGVVRLADAIDLDAEHAVAQSWNVGINFRATTGSTSIYGVLVNREAGTYSATAELRVKLNIVRD